VLYPVLQPSAAGAQQPSPARKRWVSGYNSPPSGGQFQQDLGEMKDPERRDVAPLRLSAKEVKNPRCCEIQRRRRATA